MGDSNFYPECDYKNHIRLQEPGRRHVNNQPSTLQDGNLTTGWYRIAGQAGQRLLDVTDIPKNAFQRIAVRLILLSTYAKNFIMILRNFPYSTAQKMKFSIKDSFCKCNQICRQEIVNGKLHFLCSALNFENNV